MKIVQLEAENIKRLRAVEIVPQSNTVIVGGKNGHGKTSTLDSIVFALGGKRALPEKPVREGQDAGVVCLTLDNGLTIKQHIKADRTTKLEVRTGDGIKSAQPQDVLDRLFGTLTFDPLAFAYMAPKQQVELLKELVHLDFTELDRKRQTIFEDRTAINRVATELKGQLAALPVHEDVPADEVSVTELSSQLAEINTRREGYADVQRERAQLDQELRRNEQRISEIHEQLESLKDQLEAARERSEAAIRKIGKMDAWLAETTPPDPSEINAKIAKADAVNRKVRENKKREEVLQQIEQQKAHSEELTAQIEAIDKAKRDELAAAVFPVDGLSFDEKTVLFKGIPFEQISGAEKLRVSVAMGIALNPELRVLLVRDGSLLDEDNLALLQSMADEHDVQIWIERVGKGQEVSVVIEDGSVEEVRA